MKIVALDPGGTTGWAEQDGWEKYPFDRMQLEGEHHTVLHALLKGVKPDVVVCETFRYIPGQDSAVLDSVEYIGVARLYCQSTDTPLVMQTPSQAKKLWTDDKLKTLGLWLPNAPHAMDATRHLLYYVTVTLKDLRFVKRLRS